MLRLHKRLLLLAALCGLLPAPTLARPRRAVASHGPGAEALRLTLTPRHLVLRQTRSAMLFLKPGEGLAERTGPVQVAVNTGQVGEPHVEADGRIRIDYTLPDVGYPHRMLMLVAIPSTRGPVVAAFVIPLMGVARVKVDTIPGARVYGEIAGRTSGPFTANARGEVELRLPARPGETTAIIRARDPTGSTRTRTMNLPAPPQNRVVTLPFGSAAPDDGDAPGLWVYARGGPKILDRLTFALGDGRKPLLQPLARGLLRVAFDGAGLAGWDEIDGKVLLRGDRASQARIEIPVPSSLRGPSLLLLAPGGEVPDGLIQALRETGIRPQTVSVERPDLQAAGKALLEKAGAAASWPEGSASTQALILVRPGPEGLVEERLEAEVRSPETRWSEPARLLREALKRPPPESVPTDPEPAPEPENPEDTPDLAARTTPSPENLPPLAVPTTATCESAPLPWWPRGAFAGRLSLSSKLALGGAGLAGTVAVGGEYRAHPGRMPRLPWLSDLRLLAGAAISLDGPERIVQDRLGIWLRGRYLLLDAAALLPFDTGLSRVLLLGPRVGLRLGRLGMRAVAEDAYLAPAAQFAADLALGAEARVRLDRIELGGVLGLEIPLSRLSVLPENNLLLRQKQVRLAMEIRATIPF